MACAIGSAVSHSRPANAKELTGHSYKGAVKSRMLMCIGAATVLAKGDPIRPVVSPARASKHCERSEAMNYKSTYRSLLLIVLSISLGRMALASTTWYVNGVSGSDGNNCKSPTNACKTIGHAISLASSGDTIMVAAAIYNENLTISIGLTILGSGART